MKKPPKKLSQAILLALHDLEIVEKDPRYEVNMNIWHAPESGSGICEVCFSGSVMSQTMNAPLDRTKWYDSFGEDWSRVFLALNYVRIGRVRTALVSFYDDTSAVFNPWSEFDESFDRNDLHYENDPKLFKEAMFDVATMLEVNGL